MLMLGLGLGLTMTQGAVAAPPSPSGIQVTNRASPAAGWSIARLADLALTDPGDGEWIEIDGAPAGFAIVGD